MEKCFDPQNWYNAFIASLLCREGKQGIKSKAGAIKCCKEIKITAHSNAWHNIPLCHYGFIVWQVSSRQCSAHNRPSQCPHPNVIRIRAIHNAFLCPATVLIFVAHSSQLLVCTSNANPIYLLRIDLIFNGWIKTFVQHNLEFKRYQYKLYLERQQLYI